MVTTRQELGRFIRKYPLINNNKEMKEDLKKLFQNLPKGKLAQIEWYQDRHIDNVADIRVMVRKIELLTKKVNYLESLSKHKVTYGSISKENRRKRVE